MTHSPANVMKWLLVALGVGTSPELSPLQAWPLYDSSEPGQPDNCITLYDTQGTDDGRSMLDGKLWQHHGFQVRVRSTDQPTGQLKADAVRLCLSQTIYHNSVNRQGKTYRVWNCAKIGQTIYIGKDKPRSERSLFTINATVALEQLT